MRILHTSDWHLGRSLYNRKRYSEHQSFLDWLAECIAGNAVDALVVAGDIFDTGTPSNRSQEMYYRFLCRVAASPCRHVVIVAGNHDSATFLNAPRELLRVLDIHVVGNASRTADDEVIVLHDADGRAELVVCAVPYLRDRDVRESEAGESGDDKERKLLAGIREHYAAVVERGEAVREREGKDVPLLATGHLFVAGGRTGDNSGERELYIGTLSRVPTDVFPPSLDYVALGHLHAPQMVGGATSRRYSGAPMQMSFDEAGNGRGDWRESGKSICLVEFPSGGRLDGARTQAEVTMVPVPVFQRLERIEGNWETIRARMEALKAEDADVWLEVAHGGGEIVTDLRSRLDDLTEGTRLTVVRAVNADFTRKALERVHDGETLDSLDETEVFERFLQTHEVPEEERPTLRRTYGEIIQSIRDADEMAE